MTVNNKGGRPQTLTPQQITKVVADFKSYIEENEDPTIVGFVSSYPLVELKDGKTFYVGKDYISDHDEFSELRKRAIEKQESYLVKKATKNEINPTVSIFRLKQPQHGYRDRVEQEVDLNVKDVSISESQAEQLLRARRNRADS